MMLTTALLAALAPPECDVSYKQQQQIAASTLAALEAEGWTHAAGKLAFTSGHHCAPCIEPPERRRSVQSHTTYQPSPPCEAA